jgi:hypothetical protein
MKQIAAVAVSLLCAEGAMAQDFAAALMTELTRSCPSGQPSRGEQAGSYANCTAEPALTTQNQSSISPSQSAHGKSTVVGGVTCNGIGSAFEIAFAGEIDASTFDTVKGL